MKAHDPACRSQDPRTWRTPEQRECDCPRRHEVTTATDPLKSNRLSLNAQEALHEAGIDHPTGAAGVRDLAGHYRAARQAIVDAMEEELADEAQRHGLTNGAGSDFYRGMNFMLEFVKEMPWSD